MRMKHRCFFMSLAGIFILCAAAVAAPPTHTISGVVATGAGAGVGGVDVVGDNGAGSAVTSADGSYSITVPNHWDGTITVSKTGWLITPASKTYSKVSADPPNENYTAYQPTISGSTGISGATVTVSGVGGFISTPEYSVVVPYGWSGTINAEIADYGFTESPRTYTNVISSITGQNFTPYQPMVSGTITKEGGSALDEVTVTADNGGGSATTDSNGYYQITVPYNWSGAVKANKMKWGITPESFDYSNLVSNQAGVDFTALYTGVISVKSDATGDVSTIQEAIDIAVDGDVVQVEDGIYKGDGNRDIDFRGKAITVRGNVNAPNLVVIDCQGSYADKHRGFKFYSGEGVNSILEGFTIQNGYGLVDNLGYLTGGGIYIESSSPTIRRCIITDCAAVHGGGIGCNNTSNPIIENCIIFQNSASSGAGLYGCNGAILNCIISKNSAGLWGGGAYGCDGIIRNCTIVSNSASPTYSSGGGGLYDCDGVIENNIIWWNLTDGAYRQIYQCMTPTYSSIQNWSRGGIGNISDYPMFVDAANGDYHLSLASPCINAGNPDFITDPDSTDIDSELRIVGGRVDIGADEFLVEETVLYIQKNNFAFTALEARGNPEQQTLNFYNLGLTGLDWTASSNVDWLKFNPSSGSVNYDQIGSINIAPDISNLFAGEYSGQITISDPNALNSPKIIDVNLTVIGPSLGVSQSNYRFTASKDTIDPPAQILTMSNLTGGGTLLWTITPDCDWMSIESSSGAITSGSSDVLLDIDQSKIDYGYHSCHLTVQAPGATNSPKTITVILDVPRPELTISQNTFSFSGDTVNPPLPQLLTIQNTGYDSLNWSIVESSSCDWLSVSAEAGQAVSGGPSEISISVDPAVAGYGLHSCDLVVSDPDADNSPQVITVTLDVLRPGLTVSQNSFSFSGDTVNPPEGQVLTIENTGYDALNWSISESCDWLSVSASSGQAVGGMSSELSISVDPAVAGYGLHSCDLVVSDPDADNSPQVITVTLDVLRPGLTISQDSFSFSGGKSTPFLPQTLLINNTGYDILSWSIDGASECGWLDVSSSSGQAGSAVSSEVGISVDPSGLSYGLHTCELVISDPNANNSPQVVTVTLDVLGPEIEVSAGTIGFECDVDDPNVLTQVFTIFNSGYDVLNWQVTDDSGWLLVSPSNGQSTTEENEVTLTIDTTGLEIGFYNSMLTITDNNASNNPVAVPVLLHVYRDGERHVPMEYPSIGGAGNAAVDGDHIIIHPGVYTGQANSYIYPHDKFITVRSVDPGDPEYVNSTVIGSGLNVGSDAISGLLTIEGLSFIYDYPFGQQSGRGINLWDVRAEIRNCIFKGWPGGGVVCGGYHSDVLIENCLFVANGVAGIFIPFRSTATVEVNQCTIVASQHFDGGPIAGIRMDGYDNNQLHVRNSILMNYVSEGDAEISFGSGDSREMNYASISHSTIPAGPESIVIKDPNHVDFTWGEGNIEVDPLFVRQPNDGGDGWIDIYGNAIDESANNDYGDLHLKSQAGRFVWEGFARTDFNMDKQVDLVDFSELGKVWQQSDIGWSFPPTDCDLNNDRTVDLNDLILFCEDYLQQRVFGAWVKDDVTSSCIDAGDPSDSGWQNELWPHGGRVNIGAYGGTAQASMSTNAVGSTADMNHDDAVDMIDWSLWADDWLDERILLDSDFDRNNVVDPNDLNIFLNNWLTGVE